MKTRIYVVGTIGEQVHGEARLVEATSASQAIRHVVKDKFEAGVADTKTVARLMADGTSVEVATETN